MKTATKLVMLAGVFGGLAAGELVDIGGHSGLATALAFIAFGLIAMGPLATEL